MQVLSYVMCCLSFLYLNLLAQEVAAPIAGDALPVENQNKTATSATPTDNAYPSAEELEQLMKSMGISPDALSASDAQQGVSAEASKEKAQEAPVLPITATPESLAINMQEEEEIIPTDEELQALPSPDDEKFGIDTVDLQHPSGNWLYKRIWWEKAEARYDKIKNTVTVILDSRLYFFEQRVTLDRTVFDPFYMQIGFSRGELQDAVGSLIEQLQQAIEASASKKQQRKAIMAQLQEEQENIEKLQKDVDSINNIDHAIDDALTKLMNQINVCRQYEQEAWHLLRAIARELSDKVARDHYYAMDTIWKNVKNVQQYVQGEFSTHFAELAQEAQKRTEAVTQTIQQLKEKGIDLKRVAQSALKADDMQQQEDQEESDEEEDIAPMGWFSWIVHIISWPVRALMGLWRSFFG